MEHLPAHVPSDAVERAAATARELGADALVSFGGGSVIDATKAVAARLADDDGRQLPHFAVPTTLSGAEFADHYGVTEFHDGAATKRTHTREDVTPVAVVLDGALTAATPGPLWAGSGAKALDHAVEGLICNPPGRCWTTWPSWESESSPESCDSPWIRASRQYDRRASSRPGTATSPRPASRWG